METYKIQAKLGEAEFVAEGPEASVRADYERFLAQLPDMLVRSTRRAEPRDSTVMGAQRTALDASALPEPELLDSVFAVDRESGQVSLRVLPASDSPSRAADAAILLLFGFRALIEVAEVPVGKLTAGLRESGISVERLDRFMGVHGGLFMKGGTRNGARFRLNNQGVQRARELLEQFR